ncbi:MAG: hypothetical protein HXS41_15005 [Theionarchaea archaeon]|nr:hypothetical protein [Theionarchaea archaeon]MBU6999471.1 hypothetical protein [Theionarchaea archaeon]MBU7022360.1 hypothetical protein [Theionarchaea archaeon]MBU7036097.1 hypothetical protein [Theionarchaea archaeon]MBU7041791.1 hypothetical protein [Theionarchaea archaeon]
MKLLTENERVMASIILIFIVYFGLDSLLSLIVEDESLIRQRLTFSFIVGIASGLVFYFISSRWGHTPGTGTIDRSMNVLERALGDDEMMIISLVKDSVGITQDSVRFRTGFSKSKVSALILELEKKGIIQRERSGKTYKLFLGEWLK